MTLAEQYIAPEDSAPSPFLPDTYIQFAWDSTSLGYLKTCPRLYQYIMIEGWGSKDESIHLRFGIEYHQALQDFDTFLREMDRNDAIRETLRQLLIRTKGWEVDEDTRAGKYKNRRELVRLVLDYLDFFNPDPATTYILESGKPATELSFRFSLDFGPTEEVDYLLCGHLDRVVNFSDELYVMDRKTSMSTLGSYYFDQYDVHNQMSLYTLAGKTVLQSPIKGVIIDAAQILLTEPGRFVRGITYRPESRIAEWVDDLRVHLNIAKHHAENSYWPQNDTACDKFGGCKFREVCSKSPSVRESFLRSNFTKLEPEERWNPLKPR